MTRSTILRKNDRCWHATVRTLAVVLIFTLTGPLPRVTNSPASGTAVVSAQSPPAPLPLSCGVNGLCVSGTVTNLLGLGSNEPLTIVGLDPHPSSRVVQNPDALGWQSLEAEARAMLADLHDVPNDARLPRSAVDEIRALILLRLISLAKKEQDNNPQNPLTVIEREALGTFKRLVALRRPQTAQKAMDEYNRWKSNPCGYTVPRPTNPSLFDFSFEEYEPGPGCNLETAFSAGGPRPPTADQFTAYGAALDKQGLITSADILAAYLQTDKAIALSVGILSGVVAGSVAGIGALVSVATANAFAAIAGSGFIFGEGVTVIGAASAAIAGVGAALALPTIVIIAATVGVVHLLQIIEDAEVLPTLQERLARASTPPDIVAMSNDPVQMVELLFAVVDQTIPDAAELAAAGSDLSAVPPPGAPGLGDPRFEVNGDTNNPRDVIETWSPENRLQQTFMSQGWFVTRAALVPGDAMPAVWGPWEWTLTLRYRGATLSDLGTRAAGIMAGGFFDARVPPNSMAEPAVLVPFLHTLNRTLQTEVVRWRGNRAPIVAPTVSLKPQIGLPVSFNARASDPDGQGIAAITWFLEDPAVPPLNPSVAECSLTPPGRTNPLNGFPYTCPWRRIDDPGMGIEYTYIRPGTWNVIVMASDNAGAVAKEQFTVTVGNLAPSLALTQLPGTVLPPVASIAEGTPVTIAGTVNFPALGDGSYAALTQLVVDWGDGQVTSRMYPCTFAGGMPVPSDRECILSLVLGGEHVFKPGLFDPPLPQGPWPFSFSHTYAFGLGGNMFTSPAQIRVYAVTTLNGRSQTELISAGIGNIAPIFQSNSVCPFVPNIFIPCVSGDIREAGVGLPLTILGRIIDAADARHFVKVSWGDGTSSALDPGCTAPGCPGTVPPRPFPGPAASLPPKYLSVSHTYAEMGTYPVTFDVNDGAPGGRTSHTLNVMAFGVSAPAGPAEVHAGAPVTYAYTTTLPPGVTEAAITPTCQGGQVTNQTASSFACSFGDVSARTAAKVSLRAVIGGATVERSLNIVVLPPPTTISEITGPATVTAGTTATYTYTATHSTGGLVINAKSCGNHGVQTGGTPTSIVCRFNDVPAQADTQVEVSIFAAGSSASSSLNVTVLPDLLPPALTVPATIRVNSTSHAGATAAFSASAMDLVSGPAAVTCSAQSGATFPVGTTRVSCSASDWKNLVGTAAFDIVVADVTLPSLTLPGSQTLDATSPSGAVASFTASAVDANPTSPAVTCTPASGATFGAGTTQVACSAVDAAGNRATGQFAITVRGASAQIVTLQSYVTGLSIDSSLKKKLLKSIEDAKADSRKACRELSSIVSVAIDASVGRSPKLTAQQASQIVSEATRIRSVLGC